MFKNNPSSGSAGYRLLHPFSEKSEPDPRVEPGTLESATYKIPSRVGVYTSNLVTDGQTDRLGFPHPPHWSSKAFEKHFSETLLLYTHTSTSYI